MVATGFVNQPLRGASKMETQRKKVPNDFT